MYQLVDSNANSLLYCILVLGLQFSFLFFYLLCHLYQQLVIMLLNLKPVLLCEAIVFSFFDLLDYSGPVAEAASRRRHDLPQIISC